MLSKDKNVQECDATGGAQRYPDWPIKEISGESLMCLVTLLPFPPPSGGVGGGFEGEVGGPLIFYKYK